MKGKSVIVAVIRGYYHGANSCCPFGLSYLCPPLARYITEGILPLSNFIITHLCKIID
ncbi:hypothetical protein BSCG_03245 [Bacteroides sp. 2_2_4]|nr:hypothetical protein BSCG_03245 [Bacteroides sp. 2_2_4]